MGVSVQTDASIIRSLQLQTERDHERVAIEFEGSNITYGEFTNRVLRSAGSLGGLGVERGDVVALLGHNSPEYLEILLAATATGGVALPLNWRLAAPEIAYILDHAEVRVLVIDAEFADLARAAIDLTTRLVTIVEFGGSTIGELATDDLRSLSPPIAPVAADADDVARLMYTSGTTGRPKGVMITHGNVLWKNIAHLRELGITDRDTGLVVGPLYHVGALDLTATTHLFAGAGMVIHRRFDAPSALAELASGRISTTWLAPAMFRAVLVEAESTSTVCESVRCIIGGGEKTPLPMLERIRSSFPNMWYADAYGLTETVSGDTFLPRSWARRKAGSVGIACFGIEIGILDADDRHCAAGEEGEIVLRGPKVSIGYWKDPESTGRAFRNTWFHTGDIGYLDEDGFLYVVDRLKDMIISGGENIASAEIERVLYEYPGVIEAAAVGSPDERWGEVPVAYVVIADGGAVDEQTLIEHCRSRLAKFKVPKRVEFLSALPRNPSGKILKRELRSPGGHR